MPDARHSAIDADELRRLQFAQALTAATPRVFVTHALIATNVAVFLAMVAAGVSWTSPVTDALIRWGADYGPLTTHGQWWRLVTAMFVHIGVIHLLMNMYVLWIIGRITERLFGNVAFTVLYLGTGLAGCFTSLVWHPLAVAAGASGAVFGLYGGLFGFLLVRRASMPSDTIATLAKSGLYFVLANLLYGLIAKGVDVTAHLGGFVAGIPLGCALAVPLAADMTARIQRSALVSLVGAALAVVVAMRLPTVDDWMAEMRRLATLEQQSAELYDASLAKLRADAITRDEFARVVTATVIPRWDAEKTAITGLRIPEPQRTTARRIGEYMTLKAEAWRLMAEGLRANDATMIRNGNLKLEAALVAWQAVNPDTSAMNQLGRLRATRAIDDAFAAEMARVTAADMNATRVFNDARARLNTGRMSRGQFADTIESQVLQPWNAERVKLSGLQAPKGQEAVAKKVLEYMTLKGQGWLLAAQGVRANDGGLTQKATEKLTQASEMAKSLAGKAP